MKVDESAEAASTLHSHNYNVAVPLQSQFHCSPTTLICFPQLGPALLNKGYLTAKKVNAYRQNQFVLIHYT